MKKLIISIFILVAILELAIIIKPDFFREKFKIANNEQQTQPFENNEQNMEQNQEENMAEVTEKRVVDYIETDNYANKKLKFFYYIPASLEGSREQFPVIIWVPGLDGDGEGTLYHQFLQLAEEKKMGLLTPTFKFDEANLNSMQSYQFPAVWSGNALIEMLNKAKANGLNYSKLYMAGFSAGAQFVSRFSLFKPDMVKACAILSSGGKVKPDETVKNINFFYGIGTKDDKFRMDNAQYFYDEAKKLGINVEFKTYDFGHETSEKEILDIIDFFKRN